MYLSYKTIAVALLTRLCCARHPLCASAKRDFFLNFFPNPLSAKGEERVVQRSVDRVSPLLFIHHINRLTVNKRCHVAHHHIHQPHPGFFGCPGNVRGNNAILRFKQRVICLRRFGR
jgi:hypothetical protein